MTSFADVSGLVASRCPNLPESTTSLWSSCLSMPFCKHLDKSWGIQRQESSAYFERAWMLLGKDTSERQLLHERCILTTHCQPLRKRERLGFRNFFKIDVVLRVGVSRCWWCDLEGQRDPPRSVPWTFKIIFKCQLFEQRRGVFSCVPTVQP